MRSLAITSTTRKSKYQLTQQVFACLLILAFCLITLNAYAGSGFFDDAEAINQVAKSVLMLEVYSSKGERIATGSGFVAFNNSTLVTNFHVIEDGSYIMANTDGGAKYKVSQVLCSNKEIDIAILAFESSSDIAPLALYCGDSLLRGESVVAIGSPIGITNTVSKGNISALYMEDNVPWIQFTAPISHGSSGGVLLNDGGVVIGITSAAYENTQNLNLAIRAIAAQAMYNSWDGKTHSFSAAPKASIVDYGTIRGDTDVIKGIDTLSESVQWTCPNCSSINTSLFCLQCGETRPEWVCSCGQENLSSFCGRCGNSIDALLLEFNNNYSALVSGNYKVAADGFLNLAMFDSRTFSTFLGTHSKAADQIHGCYYLWGKLFLSEKRYTDAISKFLIAGIEYLDSSELIKEAYYLYAEDLLAQGEYEEASTAFLNAGDYKDSAGRILEPYYTQGITLLEAMQYSEAVEAFEKCKEYSDAEERIKEAYHQIGLLHYSKGEYDSAIASFKKAGNYGGAADKVTETIYAKAISLGDKKDYSGALTVLATISNYKLSASKTTEYSYYAGLAFLEKQKYDDAIDYFINAGSYVGAPEKLQEAYSAKVVQFIKKGKYDDAYKTFVDAKNHQVDIEDYAIASPDDTGVNVIAVLQLANKMGFIKKIAKDEVGYQSSYVNDVIKMETVFGLKADGIIHLGEIVVLNKTLYPGYKGNEVIKVIERLKDLGYLTAKLSDTHNVYEKQYTVVVKKAEKALGLSVDGFLTPDEQAVILKQSASKPEKVKKLIAKGTNGVVSLSWSSAKGAFFYEIYRDYKKIATVTGTSYKDKNVDMAQFYSYQIAARNYSSSSANTTSNMVYVDIVYKTVKASELVNNYNTYRNKYVKVTGLRISSSSLDGKDLYVLARSGSSYIYVLFDDYYSWEWDDGLGFLGRTRITSFWARGISTQTRYSVYGYIPVINADYVYYSYNY